MPILTHIHQCCSHTGSHIIGQLQEEFKIWDGELMVAFGSLYVVGDSISAKAQGQVKDLFLLNFYSSIIHLDSNILNSSAMTINSFGACFICAIMIHWLLADCILNNSLKNTTRPDICNCETMTLWNWASNKEAPAPVLVTVSPFVPVNCHSPL